MMLFEPIEPTSESGASSMTKAVPFRRSGTNGSLEKLPYHWPTQRLNAWVSMGGAGGLLVGT